MKVNQLKAGSLLAYVQMAINVLVGLFYTPIMLRFLGQSEYGLYSTVSSTISMLSILSFGFNSSYIRFYSDYKAKKDEISINKLNGLFLIVFIIIGIVALLCGIYLSLNLNFVFGEGLTADELAIAKKLMMILSVNLAISFLMSVFYSIISAHEKYVFLKLIAMLKTVLGPFVTIPLLIMGYRSVAMVIVTTLISAMVDIVYLVYTKLTLKTKFVFKGFEKKLFNKLFVFTFFIALNIVVDQINNNIDKFLLGRYKGTVEVAIYAVGSYIYTYYILFSTAISGVFTPRIHKIINETNSDIILQKNELTKIFVKVGRVQFLILGLIVSGFVFFGKTFIGYWAGKGYDASYYVALLLMVPASVPLIQNLGIEIQRAMNKHKFRSLSYLFMAFINVGLTIVLCQKYGAIGAAFGTSISLFVMNGIVMNVYYHKKCNIDIIVFWKEIFQLIRAIIIPIVFGITIAYLINFKSIFGMLVGIASYSLVYSISMWLLGMNSFEKKLILLPLLRIRERFHDYNK